MCYFKNQQQNFKFEPLNFVSLTLTATLTFVFQLLLELKRCCFAVFLLILKKARNDLPSPVVGSSQKRSTGFVSSSEAKDNRFFSPPDSALPLSVSPIRVCIHCNKPTLASVEFTKELLSRLLIRLSNLRFACKYYNSLKKKNNIFNCFSNCSNLQ